MKTLLLIIALTLIAKIGTAQENRLISGIIRNEKNELVPFANIVLVDKDTLLIKGCVSDEKGNFDIEYDEKQKVAHALIATYIGFERAVVIIKTKEAETQEGKITITLKQEAQSLSEVIVKAQKPMYEMGPGKLIVNVQSNPLLANTDVLDALSKSPSIQYTPANDIITLRGKASILVMIDDKRLYMTGKNLTNFLQSIRTEDVDKFEIITNPSAKYEAEGLGGIINIKTKQGAKMGMNGSIGTYANYTRYANGGIYGTINYRQKKWSFHSYLSRYKNTGFYDNRSEILYLNNGKQEYKHSIVRNVVVPSVGTYAQINFDKNIGSNTTIGLLAIINNYTSQTESEGSTSIFDFVKNQNSYLTTNSNGQSLNSTVAINANLVHKYKKDGQELNINYDYNSNQYTSNEEIMFNQRKNDENTKQYLINNIPTKIQIQALKIDYTYPFSKNATLEIGGKYSIATTDNNAKFLINNSNEWITDLGRTNYFEYKETINSYYLNIKKEFNNKLKNSVVIGIRSENTNAKGHSVTLDSTFTRRYLYFFPNVNFSAKFNDNNQISLSYNRRISRPSYDKVNPFIYIIDAYTYSYGNPYIKPSLSNSFQINYMFKNINSSLSYGFEKDVIVSNNFKEDNSQIVYSMPINVQKATSIYYDINIPISYKKIWSAVGRLYIAYSKHEFTHRGVFYNNSGTFWGPSLDNTLTLPKKWSLQLNSYYSFPGIMGNYKYKPRWELNFAVQKKLLNEKVNLSFAANDILLGNKDRFVNSQQDLIYSTVGRFASRSVRMSVSYKFGNTKVDGARYHSTASDEEQQRAAK